MRLRSLHLDAGRAWRGGQRQVLLLTSALRERGHEPLVVGVAGTPLVERAHAAGLATAAVPMRGDWDLRSAKRVRALVRTWRPDLVHAHDARAHAVALLALTGTATPLVVTRRVTFPPKSVRLKYGPRVDRFIAISEAVRRAMVAAGVARDRIDVVYSGVPAPVVTRPRDWRRELGWPATAVLVGVVGAMTAEKGVEELREIATLLPPEAARRSRLLLLGGRETGACRFGEVEGFRAGFVSDIYDAMAGLDLLWHPARDEGLGTALIDSLALGVPPIAFSVGGIPEIVEHDREGLLVPPGDLRAFARAHVALLHDEARGRLAAAGPHRAALFSVDRMTENTERVYQKVLTS